MRFERLAAVAAALTHNQSLGRPHKVSKFGQWFIIAALTLAKITKLAAPARNRSPTVLCALHQQEPI